MRNQKSKLITKRVIVSGRVVEIYEYEKPIFKGEEKKRVGRSGAPFTSSAVKQDNRKKVANRACALVRRFINANPQLNKFFTLTFAKNVTDLNFARYEFDKFIKRLKGLHKNLQYIVVVEFQKRGAVHFHLLCNLPYIPSKDLENLWNNGFIRINRIDKVDNVGAYVTKYMTKDNVDTRLIGRKCYSMSKGLNKPIEYTDKETCEELIENIENAILDDKSILKRYFCQEYETEHYGTITYTQRILDKPPKLPKKRRLFNNALPRLIPLPFDTPCPFAV